MKLKISEDIISPQDLQAVITELKQYSKWLIHNEVKLRVINKKDPNEPLLSIEASDLLNQWFNNQQLSATSLSKLVVSLDEYLVNANTIRITLAGMPSSGLKKRLTKWCRQSLSPSVLIDFRYNRSLLGGMVVNCGSHIYDWSFRRKILNSKDNLEEVLSVR